MLHTKIASVSSKKIIAILFTLFSCTMQAKIEDKSKEPKNITDLLETKRKNTPVNDTTKSMENQTDIPYEIRVQVCHEVMNGNNYRNKYYPKNYLFSGIKEASVSIPMADFKKICKEIGADTVFATGSSLNTKNRKKDIIAGKALINEAKKRTQNGSVPVFIYIDEIDALDDNELIGEISYEQNFLPIYIIATTTNQRDKVNPDLRHYFLREYEIKNFAKEALAVENKKNIRILFEIQKIKKKYGISDAEAEAIYRERTGYTGKRIFGENGLAS